MNTYHITIYGHIWSGHKATTTKTIRAANDSEAIRRAASRLEFGDFQSIEDSEIVRIHYHTVELDGCTIETRISNTIKAFDSQEAEECAMEAK